MKKTIALTLCCLLTLSGCGGTPSIGETPSNRWDSIIEDISEGQFEKSDSESYSSERDGFSVEFTVMKWNPTRGAGEYVRHPADNQEIVPKLSPTDCVIPFVITTTTTTEDISFTTDYNYSTMAEKYITDGIEYLNPPNSQVYLFNTDNFENNKELLLLNIDSDNATEQDIKSVVYNAWNSGGGESYKETNTTDTFSVLGYYVIGGYYSPDFPDGNIDLLPDSGASMLVHAHIDNASSKGYELLVFTMLEK